MKKAKAVAIRPTRQHRYLENESEAAYAANILKRHFNLNTHNTHFAGEIMNIGTYQC
ncbi:hypothetical protein [Alteromonas sp. 5E99-2]|uniref:hypothetical protein n=1 Tax=Alteromonas sp. 5E99-2 TaxID=2817683 RepID=UPI001A985D2B|nr:hypothetical protein [Alteromonas sp. 5E99-2]